MAAQTARQLQLLSEIRQLIHCSSVPQELITRKPRVPCWRPNVKEEGEGPRPVRRKAKFPRGGEKERSPRKTNAPRGGRATEAPRKRDVDAGGRKTSVARQDVEDDLDERLSSLLASLTSLSSTSVLKQDGQETGTSPTAGKRRCGKGYLLLLAQRSQQRHVNKTKACRHCNVWQSTRTTLNGVTLPSLSTDTIRYDTEENWR